MSKWFDFSLKMGEVSLQKFDKFLEFKNEEPGT